LGDFQADDDQIMPHLTFLEIAIPAILRAIWMAPDWGLKVIELAEAIRRFRR
jgi:hypothetical protein